MVDTPEKKEIAAAAPVGAPTSLVPIDLAKAIGPNFLEHHVYPIFSAMAGPLSKVS